MYTFVCKNRKEVLSCPYCDSKGHLWANKKSIETVTCGQDDSIVCTPLPYTPTIVGSKMSKELIKKDRQKRSTKHFEQTVYDSNKLSQSEKKHFSEKKGFKL